jgi:hypothetical protein
MNELKGLRRGSGLSDVPENISALGISVNRGNGSPLLSRHKFLYVLDLPDVARLC